METESKTFPWMLVLIGIAATLLVIGATLLIIQNRQTRPLVQGFKATNGVSAVPCGQDSAEAEALYALFNGRDLSKTEDGKKDLNDLRNLLAKFSCMKRDLLSPSGLISAENELRFCTYSDIQPSAETTARCLSKQIPERDLDIQFEKWKLYGIDLIRRLCTSANLTEQEVQIADNHFINLFNDVYQISVVKCLTGKSIEEDPSRHDPAKYMAPELKNLQPYEGYKSKFF